MAGLAEAVKNTSGRYGLPAAVFIIGLALSAYAYVDSSKRAEAEQLRQLEDAAQNYAFMLQHRLDLYASANRALGAFFSASHSIQPEEFDNYVTASQVFKRLHGMSSFGYLPRVPAGQAGQFEADAARLFPGYRIQQRRDGGDAYFPMLYAQHALDPSRVTRLRGFDYSAIPVRWAAMQEADARDEPVATALHTALRDADQRRVALVFSPVRKPLPAGTRSASQRGNLQGFIFSVVYTDLLFRNFDNGRLAQYFDLEVFDTKVARETIIFDGDHTTHALETNSAHTLAHRAEVQFANRKWLVYFYANEANVPPASTRHAALLFAIGLLLTLIASYGANTWSHRMSRKRAMLDFNDRFGGFFENHPFAVYALDRQRRFIQVNRQMAKELGVSAEALIGTTAEKYIARDKRDNVARHFDAVMAGNAVAYTTVVTAADGRTSDLSIVLIPMSAGDKITHVLGFAENITDRKKSEKALYESRQMLQLILDNIPQSVFWKDTDSVYEGGNSSFLADTGLGGVDQLIGKTDADLRWSDQAAHFRRADLEVIHSGVAHLRMQAADVRRDGTECWIETSKIPLKDDAGKVVGVLAVTEDITARKYMEQELFRRANYDSLTGLPNRAFFNSQLAEAVKRAQRRNGLALMYFDIDRFKQINDTYGHDAGDEVIRMFGQRVRSVLRESDFIARLGGDEFVLIAEALNHRDDAALIAQKLVDAMKPVFDIGASQLQVSTSIGVAYFDAGMTPDALVKAADQAMYDAKRAGRNCFRQAGG